MPSLGCPDNNALHPFTNKYLYSAKDEPSTTIPPRDNVGRSCSQLNTPPPSRDTDKRIRHTQSGGCGGIRRRR